MKDKKLHMIGHGHIDPVWLWRWQEGYQEAKATFRSALDRMKEYPEFKFIGSSALYEWIEENDPAMFEEIKERVQEGRWSLVGLVGRAGLQYPFWRILCTPRPVRPALFPSQVREESYCGL